MLLGSSALALEADAEGNTKNRERNVILCLWVCNGVYHTGRPDSGNPISALHHTSPKKIKGVDLSNFTQRRGETKRELSGGGFDVWVLRTRRPDPR
jgi:hypothetical protein